MADQETTEAVVPEMDIADAGGVAVAEPPPELSDEQIAERAREVNIRADLFDEDEYTSEEYEAMLDMYESTLSNIEEGEIVRARVLRVTDKSVILDLGFKSEGSVNRDEFKDPDALEQGEEVEVFLENLEDEDGIVVLSKKKADFLRVWEKIREAYEAETAVPGILVRKIKGGVTVDLMGVDAFLPGSQIALRRVPNIEDLIGEQYEFKIIKLNKRRRNIVVSRRVLLEAEREIKREELKKHLEVGQIRTGVVKNITDFGAFIDLGGMDGLLHITDMSWGRVGHPSEVVNIGDEMEVKVLDIDWERQRLSLGLKQLHGYPWADVDKKYPMGSRVKGRVVSITNYGAFVELEKGVEGLVHISEMSWTRNVRHPSKLVALEDEIEAVILKVDLEGEKISLGMKQIEEDPWHTLPLKYPVGTKMEGTVRNLTSFGAFVEIEPGIDGLVHIADMSWTKRVQHPSEVVHKGDEVPVVILSVDAENKRISLGLKQATEDPWDRLVQNYSVGQEIRGTITRLQDNGVAVDLGNEMEGFVPVGQIGVTGLQDPADLFAEADELEMRINEIDTPNRRIVLEVTNVPKFEGGGPIFTQPRKSEAEEGEEQDSGVGIQGSGDEADGDSVVGMRDSGEDTDQDSGVGIQDSGEDTDEVDSEPEAVAESEAAAPESVAAADADDETTEDEAGEPVAVAVGPEGGEAEDEVADETEVADDTEEETAG
ncbi:30S ribosomal protein S1 [soil metagenome]